MLIYLAKPTVALEAVSRKLHTGTREWEQELKLFWEAMRVVFRVKKNFTCGSHVHVAPFNRQYTLHELKTIAFALIIKEHLVQALLPPARQSSTYCRPNSTVSPTLRQCFRNGKSKVSFKL